jgi:hypothetical protein
VCHHTLLISVCVNILETESIAILLIPIPNRKVLFKYLFMLFIIF